MLRPYLVDTHCHLGDAAFDADRDAVLARARAAGVTHVVVIGESLAGSERAAALTRGTSGLSASAGVHPHEARQWSDTARERVRELLAAPAMVAVGETGLDYHHMHAPREIQRNAFAAQLQLASPGSTLLTAATLRLVEGLVQVTALGPIPVKGLPDPVEVFELIDTSAL